MNDSALDRVIQSFAAMPGIGKKTAQRLAYFVLNQENRFAVDLADALREMKEKLRWCERCYNISETSLCSICSMTNRREGLLCVVEDAVNVNNIERSGSFDGYYHVLQGVLSPVNGIGPDELRVNELFARLDKDPISEVILATNPTVEGEATAMFLADALADRNLKITRIAVGVPIGGNLDYVDEITMAKAITNRRPLL
ncbi:MAG: recombination mediator RecR [Acidobacteriota bacterium]|nr:recombination mediator RecR [Acidobacteriota bacterium]